MFLRPNPTISQGSVNVRLSLVPGHGMKSKGAILMKGVITALVVGQENIVPS